MLSSCWSRFRMAVARSLGYAAHFGVRPATPLEMTTPSVCLVRHQRPGRVHLDELVLTYDVAR